MVSGMETKIRTEHNFGFLSVNIRKRETVDKENITEGIQEMYRKSRTA